MKDKNFEITALDYFYEKIRTAELNLIHSYSVFLQFFFQNIR